MLILQPGQNKIKSILCFSTNQDHSNEANVDIVLCDDPGLAMFMDNLGIGINK